MQLYRFVQHQHTREARVVRNALILQGLLLFFDVGDRPLGGAQRHVIVERGRDVLDETFSIRINFSVAEGSSQPLCDSRCGKRLRDRDSTNALGRDTHAVEFGNRRLVDSPVRATGKHVTRFIRIGKPLHPLPCVLCRVFRAPHVDVELFKGGRSLLKSPPPVIRCTVTEGFAYLKATT